MTRINSTARHRISFQTLPLPSNPYSRDGRIEFPRMSEMDEGGAEGGGGRSFLLEKITHGCPVTTDLFSFPRTWFRGYTRSCVPRDSILSPHLDRPLLLPTPPSFFGSTPRRLSSPRIFFRAWKNYLRGRHTLWNDGWKKKEWTDSGLLVNGWRLNNQTCSWWRTWCGWEEFDGMFEVRWTTAEFGLPILFRQSDSCYFPKEKMYKCEVSIQDARSHDDG